MELIDIARNTVNNEPPEPRLNRHWLGKSVVFEAKGRGYTVWVLQLDEKTNDTEILDLEIDADGTPLAGGRVSFTADLELISSTTINEENLRAFSNYILSFCLERIPS